MSMRDEITEQPGAIRRLLRRVDDVRRVADALRDREPKPSFIYLVARGTSDNAGQYAKYLFGALNRIPVALAAPSLFTLYETPPNIENSIVLGISQSGASSDLVRVMQDARNQGATGIAITNTADSPLAHAADFVLDIDSGTEHAVAATKTYTSTLATIALLAATLADDKTLLDELTRVPDAVRAALDLDATAAAGARLVATREDCVVIGRGYHYATAWEWALKMKELAYQVADPYSSADFRHGPLALVDEGFPILAVTARGPVADDVATLLADLRDRGAGLVVAGDDDRALELADVAMRLDLVSERVSPIVAAVPGQLLAWHLAHARGHDPDHPRGLKKVTSTK